MAINENAKLQVESGQQADGVKEEMTDSGDHQEFSSSASPWSGKSGFEAKVLPNGLATGGKASVAVSGSDDVVDVAALSCYLAGVLTAVAAGADQALTRGAALAYRINSITVNNAGALAVVAGTEAAAFSETRDAAGGPPLIPVDSIEIAQVRLTEIAAAPVTEDEIFQVVGLHQESYDSPGLTETPVDGKVKFDAALPLIHTGGVAKKVFATFYTPIFADIPITGDFVPADNAHSVSSTQYYGKTLGARSSALGQASFTAKMKDGLTDSLVKLRDEVLWFRFYQDRNKAPYSLTQGKLGMARTFAVSDHPSAQCTISAENATTDIDV